MTSIFNRFIINNEVVRNLLILAALVLIAVGGFVVYSQKSQAPAPASIPTPEAIVEETDTPSALPLEENSIDIKLSPQSDSSETGVVSLVEKDGKVRVVINMLGTPIDVPQPAHIHTGKCPTPGDVKYPLTNVLNGKSETTIGTTIEDLRKMMPLVVNVHKSTTEASAYVACGDLK